MNHVADNIWRDKNSDGVMTKLLRIVLLLTVKKLELYFTINTLKLRVNNDRAKVKLVRNNFYSSNWQ